MHPTFLSLPPLVLASLLLLLQFHGHAIAADECLPAACGSLTLSYPFWLGNSSRSTNSSSSPCGHPAFEVWCSDGGGGGVASLKDSPIDVLSIDYATSSLVASHARVAGGGDGVCLANFNVSSSILLSPFTISASNRALCFLFDCGNNGTASPPGGGSAGGYVNATGNCSGPIYAYLAGDYYWDWDRPPAIATGGCQYAYMPVLGSEAAAMTAANYSRLLKDGFVLDWDVAVVGDCRACNASGGQCRYDSSGSGSGSGMEFFCLCPGGRRARPTCAAGDDCGVGALASAIASAQTAAAAAHYCERNNPLILARPHGGWHVAEF